MASVVRNLRCCKMILFTWTHNSGITECIYSLTPYKYATFCILGNMWVYVLAGSFEAMCAILLFFLVLGATVHYIPCCFFSQRSRQIWFILFLNERVGVASILYFLYIPSRHCSSFCFLFPPSAPFFSCPSLAFTYFQYLAWLLCHLLPLFPYCSCSFSLYSFHCVVAVTTGWLLLTSSLLLDNPNNYQDRNSKVREWEDQNGNLEVPQGLVSL